MAKSNHRVLLVLAGLASVALWCFAPLRPVLLPVLYFDTHIHELCHALTALLTGGHVASIDIHGNASGETAVSGGVPILIGSAGYVGSAVVGGFVLWAGRTAKGAGIVLGGLAATIAIEVLLLVRGDWFGWASGLAWLLVLGGALFALRGDGRVFFAQFLGLSLSSTAVYSIISLLSLSLGSNATTDAEILQKDTGIPAIIWAVAWAVIGLTSILVSLSACWASPSKEETARAS